MIFATDIFHPLLVPLTTYTFSTSASDVNETVSASDQERLPPGGFSLRDGFALWFGRRGRLARDLIGSDGRRNGIGNNSRAGPRDDSTKPTPESLRENVESQSLSSQEKDAMPITISQVLAYIKSTFEDPAMLDRLPLEAAGNSGAWHAWRSHRGFSQSPSRATSPVNDGRSHPPAGASHRLPGDWNWEGVWENRVKNGIESSLSDPVLFGPKGGRGGEKRTDMVSRRRTW